MTAPAMTRHRLASLLCQLLVPGMLFCHALSAAPPSTHQVQGKQLTATLSASSSTIAPGQRVQLFLDIDLFPGMHVYAPGVEGYIPIEWKMQQADGIQAPAPVFPRAKKLYLKAIDETVPAYEGHFRLVRDVTIPSAEDLKKLSAGAHQVTLDGSLRYQACDDRVCYIPQTLRLEWSFDTGKSGH